MSLAGSPLSGVEFRSVDFNMDYAMESYESSESSPGLACMPGYAGFPQPMDGQMFDWQFQKTPPIVTVKNTFIDGWAEDDQGVPMVTAKSCPAPKLHVFEEEFEEDPQPRFACLLGRLPVDATAKAHRLAVQYLPNPSPDAMPAYVWPRASLPTAPAVDRETVPVEKAAARKLPPHVMPLDRRGPETSLGSDLHEAGECRPCAWFWRPQGCTNGQECRHCHLCDQAEVKLRRKSKLVTMRKQGRAAQRAQKESTAAEASEGSGSASAPSADDGSLWLNNLV